MCGSDTDADFLNCGREEKKWGKKFTDKTLIRDFMLNEFFPCIMVFTVITQKIQNALNNCFATRTFPHLLKTILQSFHFTSSYKTEYWKETS